MSDDPPTLVDTPYIWTGGIVTTLIALGAFWAVGTLHGGEAARLLEAMLPTVRFLCSTSAAAATTILALLLTTLGLSQSHDRNLNRIHYVRIRQIGISSIVTLVTALFLLIVLVIPLRESDNVPVDWYTPFYYFVVSAAAVQTGLLVMVALMVYQAISGMVALAHPDMESKLAADDD